MARLKNLKGFSFLIISMKPIQICICIWTWAPRSRVNSVSAMKSRISRLPAVRGEVARNVPGPVAALYGTLDELPRLPYPVIQIPTIVIPVAVL